MTTVRKTAVTTMTLIVLAAGLAMLMRWCGTLSGEFFRKMNALLNSKSQIGSLHSILITISFWLLLIASGIEAVYREKNGVNILGAFGTPIVFSMCVAVWGLVATSTRVNTLWFWLFYYVGLFICSRISYGRLSNIKGAGPSKIKLLLKSPPSKNDGEVSIIDRFVLYAAKISMLIDGLLLLIAVIVFCVQYKKIFGL